MKATHLLKLTKELDFREGLELGFFLPLRELDDKEAGDEGVRAEGMAGAKLNVVVVVTGVVAAFGHPHRSMRSFCHAAHSVASRDCLSTVSIS